MNILAVLDLVITAAEKISNSSKLGESLEKLTKEGISKEFKEKSKFVLSQLEEQDQEEAKKNQIRKVIHINNLNFNYLNLKQNLLNLKKDIELQILRKQKKKGYGFKLNWENAIQKTKQKFLNKE
ncbi:MAG: hypothetical protein EZS28_023346 [Streblomastix strix]|uniref:Uncharacterized protein n=1 Tax=Streblomastix strix TaxID=222440 RepID=A0A5J4VEZ2_9EUKA|nr:MAG: hypothetical protein EZS28_023346 [Streblomastix strix]